MGSTEVVAAGSAATEDPTCSERFPLILNAAIRDTSVRTYPARRDFTITAEPAPGEPQAGTEAPLFVVQTLAG